MEDRRIIGITMDNPTSIGPGITAKALVDQSIYEACRLVIVGDACVLEAVLKIVGHEETTARVIKDVRGAVFTYGAIDVLDMGLVSMDKLVRGQVSVMCGDTVFHHVKRVIELAMDGRTNTTVTNAFNKRAVSLARHHYSGHMEIYADLTGTKNYTMVLAYENIRMVYVSTHVSLRGACDRVKKQCVLDVIRIRDRVCREIEIESPRITVARLGLRSEEHDLFGREGIQEIIPAIETTRAEGTQAEGPVPPDTVFSKARGDWYDIVMAMYHDQERIPLKVARFVYNQERQVWDTAAGVNITLGLPAIRVSMDHGMIFDQVEAGTASKLSLKSSPEYVVMFARNRKQYNV